MSSQSNHSTSATAMNVLNLTDGWWWVGEARGWDRKGVGHPLSAASLDRRTPCRLYADVFTNVMMTSSLLQAREYFNICRESGKAH